MKQWAIQQPAALTYEHLGVWLCSILNKFNEYLSGMKYGGALNWKNVFLRTFFVLKDEHYVFAWYIHAGMFLTSLGVRGIKYGLDWEMQ